MFTSCQQAMYIVKQSNTYFIYLQFTAFTTTTTTITITTATTTTTITYTATFVAV